MPNSARLFLYSMTCIESHARVLRALTGAARTDQVRVAAIENAADVVSAVAIRFICAGYYEKAERVSSNSARGRRAWIWYSRRS